jgi:hypothetical protein
MELQTVMVPEPQIGNLKVTIKGTAPLIHHEWSEKAKRMIRSKQAKEAMPKKEARNPKEEYEAAKVKTDKGELAIKAIWVKQAMVNACRTVEGLPMTLVRGTVFVKGDALGMIPIKYKSEKMVEDVVIIGKGVSDLRYRPYIYDWEASVEIIYDADVLSASQVANLLKRAGFSAGIGEMRPEKGREFGTFEVLPHNGKTKN